MKTFNVTFIFLTSIILCINSNAQIYTPSGVIQGASGNNSIGIGTATPNSQNSVEIIRTSSTGSYSRGLATVVTPNCIAPIGLYTKVYNSTPLSSYRTYGVVAEVGNATSGYNYALFGKLMGSNYGTAILGVIPGRTEPGVSAMWAGYFRGNVFFEDNIGLGTQSPEVILHIKSAIPQIRFEESDNSNKKWYIEAYNGGFIIAEPDVTGHSVFIKSGGNVGIGTDNPLCKLAVNGKIRATEVEILSNINADYVFENDYMLMPLKDVETFVKENKHLPEIPSAEEFKTQGQNLGEVDNLLLKKIEELTLYVIELKKENEDQKLQIQELKNQFLNITE